MPQLIDAWRRSTGVPVAVGAQRDARVAWHSIAGR